MGAVLDNFPVTFHDLQWFASFQFSVAYLKDRIEEMIMDKALATIVFNEIKNDIRSGVPADYFYRYDDLVPYPVTAAQVITLHDGARYIAWLVCHPEHIGRGHGSTLLREILYRYCGDWILTLPSRSAVRFYEKHGFRPLADRLFRRKAE